MMSSDSKSTTSAGFCPNINFLPSEVLVHIMCFVFKDDLFEEEYEKRAGDISLVCKQWQQLSHDPSVWEDYPMTLDEDNFFPQKIKKLVHPKFSRIRELFFLGGMYPPHYTHIVFSCFQGCSNCSLLVNTFSESERSNLAQMLKSIKRLTFSGYLINNYVFQSVCNLPKLEELEIHEPVFKSGLSFQSITKLTTLKCLKFQFPSGVNNYLLLFSELPNLKRIELTGLPLRENISLLAKLTKLKVLKFFSLDFIDHVFIDKLSTLTQIQTLTIECSYTPFDYSYTLSQPLPKLTKLTIDAPIPAEHFISFLTPFLPKLEYICVRGGRDLPALSRPQIEEMI
eukprot:TRINITY_DN2878_c0_g1_i2.p1 TRINITY_DN2878_c0_g1~~TRINITY_DN2878_c0_g1_i2.p1  ORF type:complete len:340 (-),score=31.13 TRINITY_DN2878_c0_g1_i2:211-1230(-)